MLSNYRGDNNLVYDHSPLLAMARRGNIVGHAEGSALSDPDESGFADAVALAKKAEVAVLFLGLHPQWFDNVPQNDVNEGEDRDRANITLPDVQLKLLQAVAAAGMPVVLVLINGGQLAIPWAKASKDVSAIVESFYPGQMGGDAIASVLYGDVSPSGRLPYTMYDSDFVGRRPNIGDMSLSTGGGLTYQYYDGTPLWPFGFGLSYTTFALHWHSASHQITTRQVRFFCGDGDQHGQCDERCYRPRIPVSNADRPQGSAAARALCVLPAQRRGALAVRFVRPHRGGQRSCAQRDGF